LAPTCHHWISLVGGCGHICLFIHQWGVLSQVDNSGLGERGGTAMVSQDVELEWGIEERLVFRERMT
jgi:hypothetical protein